MKRRYPFVFRAVSDAKVRKHLEYLGWSAADIDKHLATLADRRQEQAQDDAADAQAEAEGGDK